MKNNTFIRTSAGTVAVFFAIAPLAHAEVLLNTHTEGSAGAVVPTLVKTEAGAKAEVTLIKEVETKSDTKVEIKKMEYGTDDVDDDKDNSDIKVSGSSDDEIDLSDDFDMDLDDAEEGGAHHASGEAEIDDANDVDTSADLEHFIEFKTKSDKHIEEIKIKDGKLIVVYAMPVKFFGFWGTTLDTTTEINAEGEAEVSYPWYSIFMKKDFSKKTLEPMFKTAIKSHTMVTSDTTVGATTTAEVSGKKTFSVPHVLEAVITIYGKVSMSDISYTK